MIIFLLLLMSALPARAQTPWQISSSSVATLAAESVVVYRGVPPALRADKDSSSTNDIVVVDVSEKDGLWSWTLLPLSTGAVSFSAKYKGADGQSVASPSVSFKVVEAALPDNADIADIREPLRARPALWPFFLALALLAAAWYAWKRWKARVAPSGRNVSVIALPPEAVATRAISELRASGLWENDQAAYYLRLTDILRAYLEARYGEPVTAMTSAEVERVVKARAQDLQIGGSVRELLTRADLVKFAKAKPSPDEGPRDADLALSVVAATTPREYGAKEEAK
jgi:hypothetical protein